jgi:hypothetical protein
MVAVLTDAINSITITSITVMTIIAMPHVIAAMVL